MEHLVRYGLDTIVYLPDPKLNTKIYSVVTHHARFSSISAVKLSEVIQAKFDRWDAKHDFEAKKSFLMDPPSNDLKEAFVVSCSYDPEEPFSATWLRLIRVYEQDETNGSTNGKQKFEYLDTVGGFKYQSMT